MLGHSNNHKGLIFSQKSSCFHFFVSPVFMGSDNTRNDHGYGILLVLSLAFHTLDTPLVRLSKY